MTPLTVREPDDSEASENEVACFGVHPMLFTAFDKQGRMNRAAMERMVDAAVFAGAHGVTILGELAEVGRLSPAEQRRVMEWVGEHVKGRLKFGVSISAPDVAGQVEMLQAAQDAGANWAMLQPPPLPGLADSELLRFFSRVADKSGVPLVVRNVPKGLGLGLTAIELRRLKRSNPNIVAVKLEADAITIAEFVDDLQGELGIINGRGALEMTDCLRAGAIGMMPGIECIDVTSSIFLEMMRPAGRGVERAEELLRLITPLQVFLTGSMAKRLLYGKMLVSLRLKMKSIIPRPPYNRPHPFGISVVERWAEQLGPLPYELPWPRLKLHNRA